MIAHILVRYHRRSAMHEDEVVSVHFKKSDALAIATAKNDIHPSKQPYIYRVISKTIK